jgi:hypothetical protein
MPQRFWLYLAALIAIAGLGGYYLLHKRSVETELQKLVAVGVEADQQALDRYLGNQVDGLKLVGLVKLLAKNRPELVRPVALRAFELEPNRRDVALLASPYSEIAKERLQFLDPLFGE